MPTPALVALEVITLALTVLLTLVKRIESLPLPDTPGHFPGSASTGQGRGAVYRRSWSPHAAKPQPWVCALTKNSTLSTSQTPNGGPHTS